MICIVSRIAFAFAIDFSASVVVCGASSLPFVLCSAEEGTVSRLEQHARQSVCIYSSE